MKGDTAQARPFRAVIDVLASCTQRLRCLGRPPSDRIARAAWSGRYPTLPPEYRSAECRDGGALDLFLDSAVWP